DLALGSQLLDATIAGTRDQGSFFQFNAALTFNPSNGSAYAVRESNELMTLDPINLEHGELGDFTGPPATIAQTPSGDAEYLSIENSLTTGTPDALDRFDTVTRTFQRNFYTFVTSGKSVRDMHIISAKL